jgi:hypothetical protein
MNRQSIAKAVLAGSIITTVAIVAIADVFNETHLFNPAWPGHARFHIAMQLSTLVLVSLASLSGLIGALTTAKARLAALAPLTFWPGLPSAWAIPGTDVYASDAFRAVGFPINIALAALFIAITLAGLWLAGSRNAVARPEPAVA